MKKLVHRLFIFTFIMMICQTTVFASYTYSNEMFDGRKYYHTYYLYVNNTEITTPVMTRKNHIPYIPLKAVVTAMGDSCTMSNNQIIVTKKDKTKIVMKPNSIYLTVNGKIEQFLYKQDDWNEYANYYPIIKNNTFYVPFTYTFSRIFGYEVHQERKNGPSTSNSISEIISIYIGKAPERFYTPSAYPYVYQYELPTQSPWGDSKISLLPVKDFSQFNTRHTTKNPIKDFLHFYDTMPNFICSPPREYPGFSTVPYKQRWANFADELRNGTYKVDYTLYGYDAYGIYDVAQSNIYINQSADQVTIGLNGFAYKTWGQRLGDDKVLTEIYDFNSAAAIHSILSYYMPNEGEKLFDKLRNDEFYWEQPVKYAKDQCTVTIRHTTGPTVIHIQWDK
ncbi:stalk domain-containing protein [Defluviitalea raffinosedens]|uniref:Copper amine oxidase-like N-terminal domain-containing protein n=1 Tax=Defluviitalea raffinosedens TaxID=1450156 RepID=A0A7C8LHK9_9FIRM|nr:stalk domain-containing protein [Defluviitalea raffinosedens]KAE9633753.1 hypothetical protein GND95_08855 [Defluviitalea raffinosedens]MBM7686096.1 hypothetical protein [Defluviitalea raffinosedens]